MNWRTDRICLATAAILTVHIATQEARAERLFWSEVESSLHGDHRPKESSDDYTVTYRFEVENDSFLGGDQFYTNGVRVSRIAKFNGLFVRNNDRDEMVRVPYQGHDPGDVFKKTTSFKLGNNIYTPSDIELLPSQLTPGDRPYGGWLYLSWSSERTYLNDSYVMHEFSAGCIGPCSRSEEIQKAWHKHVVDAPRPLGWDSQVRDEIGVLYNYEYRPAVRFWSDAAGARVFDVVPTYKLNLGNVFINGSVGALARLRLGHMNGYFDGHGTSPDIIKTANFILKKDDARWSGGHSDRGWLGTAEAFVFAEVEARMVAFNALIEGEMFSNSSPVTRDIRRGVVDTKLGIALHWARISLLISLSTRSTETVERKWGITRDRWADVALAVEF